MPASSSWPPLIRHASCVASTGTPKQASGEAGAFPDTLSRRVRLGRLTSTAITEQICNVDTLRSLGKHGPPERPEESCVYVFGGTPTMSKQAAVTSDLFRLRLAGGKVCKEVVDSERREPCWPAPRGHAKMCSSQNHRMLFLYGGYGHQTLRLVSRCHPAYQTSNRAAGRSFMDLVTTATTIGFDDVVEVPVEGDEDAEAPSVVVLQSNVLSPQTEHLNDLWCYDTALGKWSCLSPPDPFSVLTCGPQHAEHLFSFVFDGVEYLLLLGGLQALPAAAGQGVASFSKEVWLYDLTLLDWRKLPVEDRDDGPCSRGFYAACLYQTRRGVRLFVYGGLHRNGVDILDDFFFIDITGSLESGARSRWVKVALNLPPRYWHAGVLRGHIWILYGGRNRKDSAVGSVAVIDVATLTGSFMCPESRSKNVVQKWLSRFTKGSVPRLFGHRMELLPDMLSLIIVGGIRKGRGSADFLKLENGVRLEEIIKASNEAKDFPLFDVLELVLRFV